MTHEIDGFSLKLISDADAIAEYFAKYEHIEDDPTNQKLLVLATSPTERKLGLPLTPTQKSAAIGYLVSGIYVVAAVRQSKVNGQKWLWKFAKEQLYYHKGKIAFLQEVIKAGKVCPSCFAENEQAANVPTVCVGCKERAAKRSMKLSRAITQLVGVELYPIAVAYVRRVIGLHPVGGTSNMDAEQSTNAFAHVVSNYRFFDDVVEYGRYGGRLA